MKICDYLLNTLGGYQIRLLYLLLTTHPDPERLLQIEQNEVSNYKEYFNYLIEAIKLYKIHCILLSKQPAKSQYIRIYYVPSFVPMSPNENPIKVMEIES